MKLVADEFDFELRRRVCANVAAQNQGGQYVPVRVAGNAPAEFADWILRAGFPNNMDQQRKPNLLAILADTLVGVGSRILLAHAIPGSDVWDDWTPFEDTPIQEYIESLPEDPGPISPLLLTPVPEVSPSIAISDFLLPIHGLRRVFGFRDEAIARMVDVPKTTLEEWLGDPSKIAGEDRKKVAILAALYIQLARHFDGKPYREFLTWFATGLVGLGGRCLAQALVDGNAAPVLNYLALWSARDDHRNRA